MTELNIGQIITTEQERDAIHVAVVPVVLESKLEPGAHVGLVPGTANTVSPACLPHIGIIDPFILHKNLFSEQKVWLFLYPGTITSLRHDWTHPAFKKDAPNEDSRDIRWVKDFARRIDKSYEDLMSEAQQHAQTGEWIDNGCNEGYNNVGYSEWNEFWRRFTAITGIESNEDGSFYSCSC